MAIQTSWDEVKTVEHFVEITIMDRQGDILLSTIVTPRRVITLNKHHLGFDEEDLVTGKDKVSVLEIYSKIPRPHTEEFFCLRIFENTSLYQETSKFATIERFNCKRSKFNFQGIS